MARSALFHQHRRDPCIESAIVEQGGDGVSEGLSGHVIEVRLELDELLALAERGSADRVRREADHDLGAVRQVVQLSGPGPEAGRLNRHRRHRSERRSPSGQHGRACRSRQLDGDVAALGGDPFKQFDDCRSGIGQQAMGASDHPEPRCNRARGDRAHAEQLEGRGGADDVDDGVVPADLMEVHL